MRKLNKMTNQDAEDIARLIVAAIEDDIRGRRGLRQAIEEVNEEIMESIRQEWIDIVYGFIV